MPDPVDENYFFFTIKFIDHPVIANSQLEEA
jgi:hypothetical protein